MLESCVVDATSAVPLFRHWPNRHMAMTAVEHMDLRCDNCANTQQECIARPGKACLACKERCSHVMKDADMSDSASHHSDYLAEIVMLDEQPDEWREFPRKKQAREVEPNRERILSGLPQSNIHTIFITTCDSCSAMGLEEECFIEPSNTDVTAVQTKKHQLKVVDLSDSVSDEVEIVDEANFKRARHANDHMQHRKEANVANREHRFFGAC
ncbi:uncharacterized protein F5891DRAFT_984577 [Suillus fuscotomentosus]|uniref:Uncharacterized protein n=1 Tax=Suillus fuscotomentosus TaxID=1912939 RepID=A0AAD4DYJ4_9AGAM|nr:uncharacterized protein F5891DRAFT_984577 [Suillus fuscotomentosus]KAG1894993.1 hypothetical protein F5891DRAFT_984577 [Suillus fuscotomentosus]